MRVKSTMENVNPATNQYLHDSFAQPKNSAWNQPPRTVKRILQDGTSAGTAYTEGTDVVAMEDETKAL